MGIMPHEVNFLYADQVNCHGMRLKRIQPMRPIVISFFLLITSLCPAQATFAQTLAELSTPLDNLAGHWVMTGTIAGQKIVHDLEAEWVLGGHYLYLHEIARGRDENGDPIYESRVYFGWDEAGERLVCLWLDVTGGGGLVPDGFGYGKPEVDRIPFVWGEGTDMQIHNTFTYQREMDNWVWHIDNVRDGESSNFARVMLHRPATQTD